jgi:adenylyltransferase/sulfurtransferase
MSSLDSFVTCPGVIGPVVGVIGTMQAMEVINIIIGRPSSWSQKMYMFDAFDGTARTIKLRPRRADCAVCGDAPTITQLIDYEAFCGSPACDLTSSVHLLEPHERITCREYINTMSTQEHVLIDTRPPVQFAICALPRSVNIPLDVLDASHPEVQVAAQHVSQGRRDIVIVCRRGNDSQIAVRRLQGLAGLGDARIVDIAGGLQQWALDVDPSLQLY